MFYVLFIICSKSKKHIKRKYCNLVLTITTIAISEEAFQAFKKEIERNSQILVQQLLKKINDNEENYNKKIESIKEDYDEKIGKLKEEIRELDNRNQNNMTRVEEHNIRNSNIEISKPTFYGNQKDQHPIDFLQNLEEYFKIKQISREERLVVIRDCLKNAANNWYSTVKFQIKSYSEFRDAFIDEFWSREIQIQTWSSCLNTSHIPNNTTYREHFSQWASRLRHLQVPQLSEEEIVKNIANHYPGYIRAILVSLPEKSIVNAMRVLSTEENRKEVPETTNTGNNTSNQPQRNDNWRNSGGERNPRRDQPRSNWNGQPQHNNNSYPQRNWNQRGQQRENGSNQPQSNQVNIDTTGEVNEINENPHTSHAVNSIPTNNRIISPYIQCEIEGESMQLLVDTGATISVLTKEIVDRIIQNNNHVPMLPISGVQISNAVGKKICKLSKQIFCECKLGPVTIFANFVQVENLNEKGIIGADVLRQYNTQIDFSNKTVTWNVKQTLYQTPFANIEPKVITKDHQMNRIQINSNDDEHNQHLGNEQRLEFAQLLDRYQHIFSDRPGKIEQYQCRIKVKEGEPVYQRPYPIPMSKVAKMDLEIQRMLEWGIIEKSTSPWSSPIVGVEKKNGDIRVCIEARKINQRIIPDRECPSNIEEILLKFEGAQYLSSIDLTAGYWQCPLQQECREVTAFLYRGRNYQYKVLPFGLVNSIAEFQKILDKSYRVMVPDVMSDQLITETHTHFGHMGAYKTYHILRSNYRIRNMYVRIKRFTRSCELCQKSKSTGFTPTQILTGKKPFLSIDKFIPLPMNEPVSDLNVIIQLAKSRLQKRAEQRNRFQDQKRKFPTYQMGQQVLVKEHKLSSGLDKEIHKFFLLYRGPYTISQVHDNNTLVITDDQGKQQLQNFKNVKLYVPPDPGKTEARRGQ
ncbi:hypothetical protein AGLY_009892 [Aphis glycines]|uniref:RNA-directed DNA polymerase n=1 Tax=Aphis glycines TaxID=307491 RepID=A0A6G0TH80_APHGL|nr:hypothetical protein AGLY_009892 [Aphis glycines]